MGDAEALLLVDDEQPQVVELHVFLQQLVGADEQVHRPPLGGVQDTLLLLGRGEAGEDLDVDGEIPEAAHGGGVMLLGQDGGGHQDGGLLSVQDALHNGPQGHLRLAVAHVAAQQAVHGPGLFHVGLDLRDAAQLVVGLRVVEGLLKLPLPGGVRGEGEARLPLPLGVQRDEPLGQVSGGLFGLGLLLGPLGAAQLVELRALLVLSAADVLGHLVQLGDGDVQAVAAGVVDLDIVLLHAVHRHFLDAHEPAHAVVDMDHQVAGAQVRVGLELLAVGAVFQLLALVGRGGQLALRQNRQLQLGPFAAGGQGAQGHPHLTGGGHGGVLQVQCRRDVPLLQQPLEVPGPGLAAAQHQHGAAAGAVVGHVAHGGLQAAAIGGELLGVHAQKAPGPQGIPGGGQGVFHDDGKLLQGAVQFLGGQHQLCPVSRQQSGLQQGLRVLLVLEEGAFHPVLHPAALTQKHHALRRQVMDARRPLRVDSGQIAVRAAHGGPAAQPLRVLPQGLDRPLRLLLFGQFVRQGGQCIRQSRGAAGGRVGQHLRRRQHQGGPDVFHPPLGPGVKGAHGVDLIVKELAPHRLLHQRGEHVQDAAPQGELAHALHLLAAGVTGTGQLLRQFLQFRPLSHRQRPGQGHQPLRRQGPGRQGVGGGHDDRCLAPGHGVQGRQAALLPGPGADGTRMQLPLPAQQRHRLQLQQRLQIPGKHLGLPLVTAHEHRRAVQRPGHGSAHTGPLHRLQPVHRRRTAALLHPADELRHLRDGIQFLQKLFHSSIPCKNLEI